MILKQKKFCIRILFTLCAIFATVLISTNAFAAGQMKISENGLLNSINKAKAGSTVSVSLKTTDNLTMPASIYGALKNSNDEGKKVNLLVKNNKNQTIYQWLINSADVDLYCASEYTPVNLQVNFNCKMINAVKRHVGTDYTPFYFTVSQTGNLCIPSTLTFIPATSWSNSNNMQDLYLYNYDSLQDTFTLVAKNIAANSKGSVSMKLTEGGYYFLSDREVTPKEPFIMVNKISFEEIPQNLKVGDTGKSFSIGFYPCNSANMDEIWTSSNPQVIKFQDSQFGLFDCVGAGKSTLTVKNPISGISASVTLTVGENTTTPTNATTFSNTMTDYEASLSEEVATLINEERKKAKLSELNYLDNELINAATIRSREQAQSFSHTRPNGTDYNTIFTEIGYSSELNCSGENIASGQPTAADVVKAWMNSPGHRANILSPNYNSIAVGVFEYNGKIYWVQIFKG